MNQDFKYKATIMAYGIGEISLLLGYNKCKMAFDKNYAFMRLLFPVLFNLKVKYGHNFHGFSRIKVVIAKIANPFVM